MDLKILSEKSLSLKQRNAITIVKIVSVSEREPGPVQITTPEIVRLIRNEEGLEIRAFILGCPDIIMISPWLFQFLSEVSQIRKLNYSSHNYSFFSGRWPQL